jgi:protein SCO1/2
MTRLLCIVLGFGLLVAGRGAAEELRAPPDQPGTNLQTFQAQGMVKEVPADGRTVVIAHEAIPNYMEAMTMPFKVKEPGELAGLRPGDRILFRLRVTDTESWVEGISKNTGAQTVGQASRLSGGRLTLGPSKAGETPSAAGETPAPLRRHPLLDHPFTNELAQAVRLSDFRGQALAITFFFTRCPIPDYCPRLSKNFEEASQQLAAMPGGPTNWHFLSVTFDAEFDTPAVLRAYGERYQYDPKHWSFLTGPREQISELASGSDVKFEAAGGFINHNFRTLIIDAAGHLQMIFPTSGNLSDDIVAEVLKAAAVPGRPPGSNGPEAEPRTAALAR